MGAQQGVGILHTAQRCHLVLKPHAGLLSPRGTSCPHSRRKGLSSPSSPTGFPRISTDTVSCLSPLALGEVWGSPSLSHHDKGGAGCFDKNPTLPSPESSFCFGK